MFKVELVDVAPRRERCDMHEPPCLRTTLAGCCELGYNDLLYIGISITRFWGWGTRFWDWGMRFLPGSAEKGIRVRTLKTRVQRFGRMAGKQSSGKGCKRVG